MLEEAHQLAADGGGCIPAETEAVPPDRGRAATILRSRSYRARSMPAETLHSPHRRGRSGTHARLPGKARGFGSLVHEVLARIDWRGERDIAGWCEHLAAQHVPAKAREQRPRERAHASGAVCRLASVPGNWRSADPPPRNRIPARLAAGRDDRRRPLTFAASSTACTRMPTAAGTSSTTKQTTSPPTRSPSEPGNTKCRSVCTPWPPSERSANRRSNSCSISCDPAVEHSIPWNDTARCNTIGQINREIAATTRVTPATDWSLSLTDWSLQ